jgi:CheY-like chemotaxis protein
MNKPAEIFYVEDNPGDVLLLREAIRDLNEGVRLVTADDGEQALAHLLSASVLPSVIVLDLNLPRVDGFQVLNAVKSHPKLREVATVVFAEKAARKEIELTGINADAFFTKPMDLSGYRAIAAKLLDLCQAGV